MDREELVEKMATPNIVVIHQDEYGDISVYRNGDVEVFWVDERAADDRVFQMAPQPIPEGMLHGTVGRNKDGSAADAKAHAVVAMMEGRSHLSVVENE